MSDVIGDGEDQTEEADADSESANTIDASMIPGIVNAVSLQSAMGHVSLESLQLYKQFFDANPVLSNKFLFKSSACLKATHPGFLQLSKNIFQKLTNGFIGRWDDVGSVDQMLDEFLKLVGEAVFETIDPNMTLFLFRLHESCSAEPTPGAGYLDLKKAHPILDAALLIWPSYEKLHQAMAVRGKYTLAAFHDFASMFEVAFHKNTQTSVTCRKQQPTTKLKHIATFVDQVLCVACVADASAESKDQWCRIWSKVITESNSDINLSRPRTEAEWQEVEATQIASLLQKRSNVLRSQADD